MLGRTPRFLFPLLLLLSPPTALAQAEAGPDSEDPLRVVSPLPGSTIYNATPVFVLAVTSGSLDMASIRLTVDGVEMADASEAAQYNGTHVVYVLSSLFALEAGGHEAQWDALVDGRAVEIRWSFHFEAAKAPARPGLSKADLLGVGLLALGGLGAAAGSFLAWARLFRGWTWEKFGLRHPVQRRMLPFYLSGYLSAAAALLALLWLETGAQPPRFATEFIILGGAVIALGPYAADVQRRRIRARAYESAYAQFLFEMADSVRGGIDPMKSVTELATTDTSALAPHLRVAADGLRLGRPFESTMRNMARPLGSALVNRYANLLGEAAKFGGDISGVIHRAARDMDEMVKIGQERQRQMMTPVITMYIAFGVLLWMVKSLMDFAPGLASTDFASSGLFGEADVAVPRMDLATLEARFFHLTLLTSLGTGMLIGSFTDGKLRYGLSHAFAMLLVAAAFFYWVVL